MEFAEKIISLVKTILELVVAVLAYKAVKKGRK